MAEISHRYIETNGIRMHIAEAGPTDGPAVIMLHGFPETWYSWRHQLRALGDAGYHAIAPDMRGMGRTTKPASPREFTQPRLVGDIVGLLAALPHEKAVICGHDWGAPVAWNCALMRPDLFYAVIGLSVPFYGARTTFAYDHSIPPSQAMEKETGPEGFHYQLYFNEVGRAEADLNRNPRDWLNGFFFTASGDAPAEEVTLGERKRGDALHEAFAWPKELPKWMTDADLDAYAEDYDRTGFDSALNYYRAADHTWHEMAPFRGSKISVPAYFIAGDSDLVILMNEEITENFPNEVSDLRGNVRLPGCGHWTQQERPEEVNQHMLAFLEDVTTRG
jgi:pimeloyl-ACP methyl ester carboxylesterase